MGRAFSHVCLFVGTLTRKRLRLSTPNLVHVYSIAVATHAWSQMSKGQRTRSHSYESHQKTSLLLCLSVCPHSKRKTAWAINNKLVTHVLYSSRSACLTLRSKGQGHMVQKPSRCTVANDYSSCPVNLCCAACCRCRRGSACRYGCLWFLVFFCIKSEKYIEVV